MGYNCHTKIRGNILLLPLPGFLQVDVLESPLLGLGGYIKAGLGYLPAKVAASRGVLGPAAENQG